MIRVSLVELGFPLLVFPLPGVYFHPSGHPTFLGRRRDLTIRWDVPDLTYRDLKDTTLSVCGY